MSRIELKNIDKYYGSNHVLKNLTLSINDGEFMTLLGPSGCGKTTTLRVIAGLEKPQNGCIDMDGREIVQQTRIEPCFPKLRAMAAHDGVQQCRFRPQNQTTVQE